MKKKVLASILVASMMMSMAACGSKEEPASNENGGNEPAPAGTETGDDSADAASDLEPVTLKMYLHGSNVTDDSAVMEEVNAYLQEKINVTLEPIWGTWGDFDDNSVLALQGGDDVDIYFTCSWSKDEYNRFARDGYWVRLDDPENNLIEQYASDLWAELPDVLKSGATIPGDQGTGIYAVPGYKDIATQNCWDVNVTRLKEMGHSIDEFQTIDYYSDEFKNLLQEAKDKYGADFYPLLIEGAVLERMVTNTIIVTGDSGSGNFMSYYLDPTDVTKPSSYGNEILNKFATPEFEKFAKKTREYFEAGFINPADANPTTANENRTAKQGLGEYLIGTQSYSLGYELQASQERNIEVAMVPCTAPYVDTTSSQGAMMAIAANSANPERAMMFLNLLNTDPKLMTMLNYGIEGIHYNLVDGCVEFTDERENYVPWTNGMGNVTILPPTVEQGKGFWDDFKAYYGEAEAVPVVGFVFDATPVETEMAAVSNVVAEYMLSLCTGSVNPDEKLPEFLKKLEENGVQKVIDEANAQLTAYLAE